MLRRYQQRKRYIPHLYSDIEFPAPTRRKLKHGVLCKMPGHEAKFQVGELIHHKLFDYLGVVFDVDPVFNGSDMWYDQVARSRPPKDKPWYHVLVDRADHTTYVAEQNLAPVDEFRPISHTLVDHYFREFDGKKYSLRRRLN